MRIFKLINAENDHGATVTHLGMNDGNFAKECAGRTEYYTEVSVSNIGGLQVLRAEPGTPQNFLIFFGNPA